MSDKFSAANRNGHTDLPNTSVAHVSIPMEYEPRIYVNAFTVDGGNIIKRNWRQLWREPQFPPLEYIVASLDTAFTDKTSNDQSALTVWGLFRPMVFDEC
jgi:hypothetical protein